MSIPDDELPPISAQDSFMDANLSSTLAFNFLMGMYTLVYFGTLRLYYSKTGPLQQRRIVISAISVLYIMCTCIFALDWYWLKYAVIDNGYSHSAMFNATVQAPQWAYIALVFLQFGMFVVSDGVLIWRCFYVWDRSLRVISLPLFLLVAEIGLYFVITTYASRIPEFVTSPATAALENNLQCAGLFTSLGTTVLTTFLIGYRIYSASRIDGVLSMGRRFEHIIKVLVESAAGYSVVIFVNAVFAVIPFNLGDPLDIGSIYAGLLLPIAAGLATTIVVARIAIASRLADEAQHSTSLHISGLNFQPQGTQQTYENEVENRDFDSAETIPNVEKRATSFAV